jgi:hypothetical protein
MSRLRLVSSDKHQFASMNRDRNMVGIGVRDMTDLRPGQDHQVEYTDAVAAEVRRLDVAGVVARLNYFAQEDLVAPPPPHKAGLVDS